MDTCLLRLTSYLPNYLIFSSNKMDTLYLWYTSIIRLFFLKTIMLFRLAIWSSAMYTGDTHFVKRVLYVNAGVS